MSEAKNIKALILHPINVVAELIRFSLESEFNCRADIASDLTIGKKLNQLHSYSIILSATDLNGENPQDFFKELVDANKLPFFFLIENKSNSALFTYKNNSPKALIPEAQVLEKLGQYFKDILTKSDEAPAEWTKISLLPLVHFDAIPEDVYIQLKTGRFLKLFQRGDKITTLDVERYNKKGVTNLYLKKEAYSWLVKQIDAAMPSVINSPEEAIVVAGAEDNIVFKEECPVVTNGPFVLPEEVITEVHNSSQKVLLQMKKNKELSKLLKNLNVDRASNAYFKNRIDLVCNISCALAKELSWSSDAMFEKLIYIAYTHDIALVAHPKLYKIQTTLEFESMEITEEEKKLVLNHPNASADLVMADLRAPAEAEQIIRQHHERPSSKGFPEELQTIRILPMAALVGVSIDFAQFIIDNPKWTYDAYYKHATSFRGGTFTKILKGLESMCRGKV